MTARLVQERLNAAGFGPLAVDGKIGPATVAALDRALSAGPVESAGPAIDPNHALLIKELERDEGRVLHAYQDSLGWWSIGIGRLVDKRKGGGISNAEADYLKANDIARFKADLDRVAQWWRKLDPVRQRAVQNLAFNLGTGGLVEKWPNTVALIRDGKYARGRRRSGRTRSGSDRSARGQSASPSSKRPANDPPPPDRSPSRLRPQVPDSRLADERLRPEDAEMTNLPAVVDGYILPAIRAANRLRQARDRLPPLAWRLIR